MMRRDIEAVRAICPEATVDHARTSLTGLYTLLEYPGGPVLARSRVPADMWERARRLVARRAGEQSRAASPGSTSTP